jgi:uncharacterized protein
LESREVIKQMVSRIALKFHPRKIILFGSWARKEQTADSDVDLMVVVDSAANRRDLRVAMRRTVNGLGLPKDIIVVTSEEFEMKRNIPGSIVYPADKEGEILYVA